MVNLTVNAQSYLNDYMSRLRKYLKGCKSCDAEEIQQNVTEHIESELGPTEEPVSVEKLKPVLIRLGSPEQFVPAEELSWYRRILLKMQHGPDDWRLSYICFGLFILGLITGPGLLIFIPLSFYIARAALNIAGGKEELGNQRILLYPSLVVIYLVLAGAVLFGPIFLFGGLADGLKKCFPRFPEEVAYWRMAISFIVGATGLWWLIVMGIVKCKKRFFEKVFYPFTLQIGTKTQVLLITICMIMSIAGIGLGCYWLRY